jgi:hypothetical protein
LTRHIQAADSITSGRTGSSWFRSIAALICSSVISHHDHNVPRRRRSNSPARRSRETVVAPVFEICECVDLGDRAHRGSRRPGFWIAGDLGDPNSCLDRGRAHRSTVAKTGVCAALPALSWR